MSSTDPTQNHGNNNERQVLTVTELNRRARQLLEIHLPLMWIEGELSNLSKPGSGHWYFTMKDDGAQVRCAMFRNRNNQVNFKPAAGDKVIVRARVSLYEGRGDYQLIVEHMEEAGFGLLQKRYEELKYQLQQEGLFDLEHKKPLPCPPAHLAVITSPTGAAIQDVLSVLQRRFPSLPVTIIPATVQGDGAAQQVIRALTLAEQHPTIDAILLCRGGGSIEDLWAFNHEGLARAIYQCTKPTISAVGHEIDFTIADFVADARAPTPSAAAEMLSPDTRELTTNIERLKQRLITQTRQMIERNNRYLTHARQRIRHPGHQLQIWAQRLDYLELRLQRTTQHHLFNRQQNFAKQQARLNLQNPIKTIENKKAVGKMLHKRLHAAFQLVLRDKNTSFQRALEMLDVVSPLNTLKRGYAIVKNEQGTIVRRPQDTELGEKIKIKLADGEIQAVVK